MELTAQDIEQQVFREKFKGYDQDEVDAFLDRVAERINELVRERDAAIERMHSVEADAADSIEAERLLKRTLITAQRTADETVAEAVAQANATVSESEQRATQLLADAEARALDIVQDAERRAGDLVATARREAEARAASADADLEQVRRAVAELNRFRVEYRERVRAAVAEQLALLDRADNMPDVPPEMARLAALPDAEDAPRARVDGGKA
jgi:cell division initiation protein